MVPKAVKMAPMSASNTPRINPSFPVNFVPLAGTPRDCEDCGKAERVGFQFDYAYQPIVDVHRRTVFAHEALVRGPSGEGAMSVLSQVNEQNRYRFDQACRVKAIKGASQLQIQEHISINFLPNAIYKPEMCIRTTLAAAELYHFPIDRIIFEITEGEKVENVPHLRNIIAHYQQRGFHTAIDDFGAGYAGLNLLADLSTDIIKLDMALIRNIHQDRMRQAIVKGTLQTCIDLGTRVVAEGVETREELATLYGFGIRLFQGYYFARPGFETLPEVPAALFDLAALQQR